MTEYYPLGRGGDDTEAEYHASQIDYEDLDGFDEAYVRLDNFLHATPRGMWGATVGDVRISDMTDAHLRNAVRWLYTKGFHDHPKCAELEDEQRQRVERGR